MNKNTLTLFAGIAITSLLSACSTITELKRVDSAPLSMEKVWEIDSGVSQPESVLVIPGHQWLYVSNVNGEDKDGFISKVSKDGVIETLKWAQGIHTPTGMGFYDSKIYVADQNKVHIIDIHSGAILKTLPSQAKTLNDIAVTSDGRIFVTDLVSGGIYTVENDQVVLWTKSTMFTNANGILAQGDELIVGSVGTRLSRELKPNEYGSLYRVNLTDKSVNLIGSAEKIGLVDGVQKYQKGHLVSGPMQGKVFYVDSHSADITDRTIIGEVEGGIADIAFDSSMDTLYAPILFANKLAAYRIVSK